MSAPYENHSESNYPEDKVTHYPRSKAKKMAKKASHAKMGKKEGHSLMSMDGPNKPCPHCAARGHTASQHKQMIREGKITR